MLINQKQPKPLRHRRLAAANNEIYIRGCFGDSVGRIGGLIGGGVGSVLGSFGEVCRVVGVMVTGVRVTKLSNGVT